ncbi:MAG: ribonuclease HI family protein [Candidatus Micrarchaeia archaeon]
MKFSIYTDGAARGNPGKSASGYMVYVDGRLIIEASFYNGICTNNVAEYKAALKALKDVADKYGYSNSVELYSDSKLMVSQLNQLYKTKDPNLKKLNSEIIKIAKKFEKCEFFNVPREEEHISAVDQAINRFLDSLDSNKYHNNEYKHITDNNQKRL